MERDWIRASEIGEYLYCQRAWWYRLQDVASANVQELAEGSRHHLSHGRGLLWARMQRVLALALVLVAAILLALQFIQ